MVRAMNEGEGGRGDRGSGRLVDQHSRRQGPGTEPVMGRRTLVEQAPQGTRPVQAVFDEDPVQDRAGRPAAHTKVGGDRGRSASSEVGAPVSIFDVFGTPVRVGTDEPSGTAHAPRPGGDPVAERNTIEASAVQRRSADGAGDAVLGGANVAEIAGRGISGAGRGGSAAQRAGVQREPSKTMDRARYRAIELQLNNLVSQKKGLVGGTGTGDMAAIDAQIDQLISELRVDFGVQLDRGRILDDAVAGKDMLVIDGRIVLSPSGASHYMGERLDAKLEIDHVPPGETLQIGWRWRTPGSGEKYRFLVSGPAFGEKTVVQEMVLDTPFWGLVPPAVEKAQGLEILAEIYIGNTGRPTRTFSTGFLSMPERPVGEVQIVGAPDRVVKDSHVELGIGPWTPDFRRYSIDWFVDDVQVAADQLALRHPYGKLGKHVTRADVYRVRRSFGIRDKQLVRSATTSFEVLTDEQYGNKFLTELEHSPFRPEPVGVDELLASGDRSLDEIQHRIEQGGSQQDYWKDRQKAQKERLAKVRELAPDHAVAKPLPPDPTKLEAGGSYSGPVTAALVMSSGGGAQPLTLHLTIHDAGGVWQARLIDSTSKKVLKADGSGATPLAAYTAVFEAWRTDHEYPTGGHVVHRFAPPGWSLGGSFSTTTPWKRAKEWVDGILQVGGFLVGMLLLADPDPTISKLLGGLIMAAVVARSSVAIYERIRNGGDVLSTENILDAVAIVTSFVGLGGGALRSIGITARSPITYRVGNWMIMSAVAGDAGTFLYASAEAIASLRTIQADPTMDDGQKSGELLRIMGSLFLSGALLIATNRELFRNGLEPHDFIRSDLQPGMKPELDIGARLDAEYELKKGGQWSKETSQLSDEAVLDKVFTQRSRQDLEAALANQVGARPAAALADALGNEAFVRLHHTLGEDAMAALARDVGPAKAGELHRELGTSDFGAAIKELGAPRLKQLADALTAKQVKLLVDGLGAPTVKRTAGVLDLGELKHLSLAGAATLKKLAHLHGFNLKNLSHRTPAELTELAKLDLARIDKLSALPSVEAAKAAPFSEASVDAKLADLGATEQHITAELADPATAHHLRETNFADRGRKPNTGGKGIKLTVAGKGGPVSIETPDFVRLEPIPPGAPGTTPISITRVEVEAPRSDSPTRPLVKGDLVKAGADWNVPVPGNPYPRVAVEVAPGGLVPYVNVEAPPPGTRIQVKPKDVASSGLAGGHTREAWNTAERTYGDFVTKTGETGIRFKLPGASDVIEAAAIKAEVKVGARMKQLPDPKTVFEKTAQLNAFESHAKRYMAAKVEVLGRSTPKPAEGSIITIDVPVSLIDGTDAIVKVEMPWSLDPRGALEIRTWWLAESNFKKGSRFNP